MDILIKMGISFLRIYREANDVHSIDKDIESLQNQIETRQKLITTLNEEIEITSRSINRSNDVVGFLEGDVARLKEEYSEMLRLAYRQKLNKSS